MRAQSQLCPLCVNRAEYYVVDPNRRKRFLCSNCTQFQIAVDAESRVSDASPERRPPVGNRESASAGRDARYHADCDGTAAQGDPSALAHEYVENSQLPS